MTTGRINQVATVGPRAERSTGRSPARPSPFVDSVRRSQSRGSRRRTRSSFPIAVGLSRRSRTRAVGSSPTPASRGQFLSPSELPLRGRNPPDGPVSTEAIRVAHAFRSRLPTRAERESTIATLAGPKRRVSHAPIAAGRRFRRLPGAAPAVEPTPAQLPGVRQSRGSAATIPTFPSAARTAEPPARRANRTNRRRLPTHIDRSARFLATAVPLLPPHVYSHETLKTA